MFDATTGTDLHRMASEIQQENRCLIKEMRIEPDSEGIVLHGFAYCFHGKQIALREAQSRSTRRVVANRIRVKS